MKYHVLKTFDGLPMKKRPDLEGNWVYTHYIDDCGQVYCPDCAAIEESRDHFMVNIGSPNKDTVCNSCGQLVVRHDVLTLESL